jgi:hypothetical protein
VSPQDTFYPKTSEKFICHLKQQHIQMSDRFLCVVS